MTDRARVDQPIDRLIGGQHRRQRDHGDQEQPTQILRAAIAVGVALRRRPAREPKRDQQRHRRQRVRDVVQRVAQQRHRARQQHDDRLNHRRHRKPGQADQQRPTPCRIRLQDVVHLIGRIVRMTTDRLRHAVTDTSPHRRTMTVTITTVVVVEAVRGVRVVVLVRHLLAGRLSGCVRAHAVTPPRAGRLADLTRRAQWTTPVI
jgi:hypothetical protein